MLYFDTILWTNMLRKGLQHMYILILGVGVKPPYLYIAEQRIVGQKSPNRKAVLQTAK